MSAQFLQVSGFGSSTSFSLGRQGERRGPRRAPPRARPYGAKFGCEEWAERETKREHARGRVHRFVRWGGKRKFNRRGGFEGTEPRLGGTRIRRGGWRARERGLGRTTQGFGERVGCGDGGMGVWGTHRPPRFAGVLTFANAFANALIVSWLRRLLHEGNDVADTAAVERGRRGGGAREYRSRAARTANDARVRMSCGSRGNRFDSSPLALSASQTRGGVRRTQILQTPRITKTKMLSALCALCAARWPFLCTLRPSYAVSSPHLTARVRASPTVPSTQPPSPSCPKLWRHCRLPSPTSCRSLISKYFVRRRCACDCCSLLPQALCSVLPLALALASPTCLLLLSQKAAFQCSVKCCDLKGPQADMQKWCVRVHLPRNTVKLCEDCCECRLSRVGPHATATAPNRRTSRGWPAWMST